MRRKPILAITMGDPGGVGPEIVLKALKKFPLRDSFYLLVVGSLPVFEFEKRKIGLSFRDHAVLSIDSRFMRHDRVNFLDVTNDALELVRRRGLKVRLASRFFEVGKVSPLNGAMAFAAVEVAAYQAACGLIEGIVTAPISKESCRLIDPHFVGHTEYLAKVSNAKEFAMCFYSKFFCVTLATIHLPIHKVPIMLKRDEIASKIKLTYQFLRSVLKISKPKIAVAALNPHGREFGREEDKVIRPAIEKAARSGFYAEGPFPGDQVFFDAYQRRFDAVVAMYHDQGLAPFKLLAFDKGVNVTLGLPFVRTSPDHGTGFNIAYQNKADSNSFLEALKLAHKMVLAD